MSGMSELNDPKWFTETHLFHVPHAYRDTFSNHLDLMIKEDKLDDDMTSQLLQLHLYQFFLYVHRWCRLLDDSSSSAAIDDPILEAARFISENYNQNISLDMLASRACLSSGYFSKRFRQVTGVGMKEYLTYVRLEHASQELLSTDHTITDVALNSGFADSNYFKDAFKKMYGASPRNFRKNRNTDSVMAASIARMQSGLPQK
jgi:AraC-like DNA-binding protein